MNEQTTQQGMNQAEQPGMFQVVNEGFTIQEAIEEAKRCLHCKVPQCKKGCPIENDIPDFVHELSMGNMGAAMTSSMPRVTCLPSAAVSVRTRSSVRETACWARRVSRYR